MIIDFESYKNSLEGGLFDDEYIKKEMEEIKNAPVGFIKSNCWKKTSDNTIDLYEM